ncbi:MAG: hypothetical protein ACO1PI_04820 [Bacteroidota bacterium]
MRKLLVVLTIVCLATACNTDKAEVSPDINVKYPSNFYEVVKKLETKSSYYGSVSYAATRVVTGTNAPVLYDARADFFTTTDFDIDNRVSAGILSIGSFTLTPNSSNGNAYYFNNNQNLSSANSSQFGTNVTFSITGDTSNGFNPDSTTIYVPAEIKLTGPFSTGSMPNHSKVSSINVTWNADPNNDSVALLLVYEGALSYRKNNSLSSTLVSVIKLTEDDGSYTISPSDFSSFPVGGIATLYVGRIGEDVLVSNGKTIPVYAYTWASQQFDILP